MNIQKIDINSQDYPAKLRELEDAPKQLYFAGDITMLSSQTIVAVAGTRRCSPYGRWVSHELGRTLALSGATHIGGMSEGIQNETHRAVLDESGKSIAVLGTGIDICFPKSALSIYERLCERGLLISEYEPGSCGKPANFIERNRIIAGLADKIVVVEGSLKSGAAVTACLAIHYGKELYAVPGNINQPASILPNKLIKDGAITIPAVDGIPETLGIWR